MAMDFQGNIYVAAVNSVYVISPYGYLIKNISVHGAEELAYSNGILVVASGTLPNHTVTLIDTKNFTVVKIFTLNVSPLSVAIVNGKIFIGTYNGVMVLEGDEFKPILTTPGPVISLVSGDGMLFAAGYNFSQNYGFVYFISSEQIGRFLINNTFPNSLYYYYGRLYVAADFLVMIINLENHSYEYVKIPGEKIEGVTVKGGLIYATADSLYGPDYVLVLNSTAVLDSIKVGITPIGIIYNNVSNYIFVSNFFDGSISMIGFNCSEITSSSSSFSFPQVRTTSTMHGENIYPSLISYTVILAFVAIIFFIIIYLILRGRRGTS